jgi:hypothetical protein
MNYSEWLETFKPMQNHLDDHAGFDGHLFETFGEEIVHVRTALDIDAGKVWTLIDVDGSLYVSAGYSHVNRVGYFITEIPTTDPDLCVLVDGRAFFTLPAHWASALLYGDESGLSDEESTEIAGWLESHPELGECVSCNDDPEFCTDHDAGGLACDCLVFEFEILEGGHE